MRQRIVFVGILLLGMLFSGCMFSTLKEGETEMVVETHIINPVESNEAILNPGKGWVLYGMTSDQTPNTVKYGSIGYIRYNWCDIEKEEGAYDWTSIDRFIDGWAKVGKQAAFGIMAANSSSNVKYITPQYVFDAGAEYTEQRVHDNITDTYREQVIPKYDDPVFMEKLAKFIGAVAERYDGNPHIAFYDIRSIGNWGEGHSTGGMPGEKVKEHIQMHLDAFQHTQLMLPWGESQYNLVYDWAVDQGVGIRRDGILGNSKGEETARALGKAPGVFEFWGPYTMMVEYGWWNGENKIGYKGHGGTTLKEAVELGKPSYIGMGQWGEDARVMLKNEEPLIKELANRMGYHFVLTRGVLPVSINNDRSVSVELEWLNKGVAPIYVPCSAAAAILDDQDQVLALSWLEGSRPSGWMPSQKAIEEDSISFSGLEPGEYKLAVGLFTDRQQSSPDIRIGIQGGTAQGWYVLSSIKVNE